MACDQIPAGVRLVLLGSKQRKGDSLPGGYADDDAPRCRTHAAQWSCGRRIDERSLERHCQSRQHFVSLDERALCAAPKARCGEYFLSCAMLLSLFSSAIHMLVTQLFARGTTCEEEWCRYPVRVSVLDVEVEGSHVFMRVCLIMVMI